jgi:predicted acetyltransferase
MPNLQISIATYDDETTLRNLGQFYIYEYTQFMKWDVTYAGRFNEDDFDDLWGRDSYRKPYLFHVDNKLAGFAIINLLDESHITGAKNVIEMSEFFIMAAYQRKGYGAQAATQLFDKFRGDWEVFELEKNLRAQAFWRKVIGRYTNGNYREQIVARGVVQLFSNRQG